METLILASDKTYVNSNQVVSLIYMMNNKLEPVAQIIFAK